MVFLFTVFMKLLKNKNTQVLKCNTVEFILLFVESLFPCGLNKLSFTYFLKISKSLALLYYICLTVPPIEFFNV